MRLLIATPLYPPEPGGPATYTKLLEEYMPREGVEVEVVKFSSVRRLPKLLRHVVYMLKVARRARHADMVLVLDPVSTGLPVALATLFVRRPFVLKVVGDYAWEQGRQRFGITATLDEFVHTQSAALPVIALCKIERWVAHRATRVIVPSNYLKRIVEAWGIRPARIEVIHNAVELPGGGTAEMVADVPHPWVVTAGRLVPWKHIDGVIDAVSELPTVSLVVVGSGPDEERLKRFAAHKLGERAYFTGALANADAVAVMREADALVLNSSYEGFSHVLAEAYMLAVPVVLTSAGGNSEVIGEGEGAVFVPPKDVHKLREAIAMTVGDKQLKNRLESVAGERRDAFSVPAMISRTKLLLESLV